MCVSPYKERGAGGNGSDHANGAVPGPQLQCEAREAQRMKSDHAANQACGQIRDAGNPKFPVYVDVTAGKHLQRADSQNHRNGSKHDYGADIGPLVENDRPVVLLQQQCGRVKSKDAEPAALQRPEQPSALLERLYRFAVLQHDEKKQACTGSQNKRQGDSGRDQA